MAEAAIRETGMEYAFLRPSWVYGPGDHSMNRFVFFCRRLPFVPVIGNGRTPVWPAYVKDVARAAVDLARREDTRATVLDIGGPERLTMDGVVRAIQQVLGRRRPIVHHPVRLMKLLSLPMQVLPRPILSPTAIEFLIQEVPIDPRPAFQLLGFTFRRLEDGLREYLL
jgi:NADH dehydrogenase